MHLSSSDSLTSWQVLQKLETSKTDSFILSEEKFIMQSENSENKAPLDFIPVSTKDSDSQDQSTNLSQDVKIEITLENENQDNSTSTQELSNQKSPCSSKDVKNLSGKTVNVKQNTNVGEVVRKRKRNKVCNSRYHRLKNSISNLSADSDESAHSSNYKCDSSLYNEDISCFRILNVPLSWSYVEIKEFVESCCGPLYKLKMVKDIYGNFKGKVELTFDDCIQAAEKLEKMQIDGKLVKIQMMAAYDYTDSDDDEHTEPRPKRDKPQMAWRPDLDVWEVDPKGLYGIKPGYLRSLGIKPPIEKWVHVSNFRCDKFDLKNVLELAGNVLACSVISGIEKYAKVMYSHPLEAVQAIALLDGQRFYGMPLKISMCKIPPTALMLPKGLPAIGPGLGIVDRPIRDIVRQYERFVHGQSSLLKSSVFIHPNKLFDDSVNTEDDRREEESRSPEKTEKMAEAVSAINKLTERGISPQEIMEIVKEISANPSESDKNESFNLIDINQSETRSVSPPGLTEYELSASYKPQTKSKDNPPGNSSLESFPSATVSKNTISCISDLRGSTPFTATSKIATTDLGPIGARPPHLGGSIELNANVMSRPNVRPNYQMTGFSPQNALPPPGFSGNFRTQGPIRPMSIQIPPSPFVSANRPMGLQGNMNQTGLISGSVGMHNNFPRQMGPFPGPMQNVPPRPCGPFVGPPVQGFSGSPKSKIEFRNLPPSTTFTFLCEILSKFGSVMSVQMTTPGCAVAQFANPAQAQHCFQQMNKTFIHGYLVELRPID